MNNILSFNEYNGQELEVIAYENVLNEKSSMSKGIRGFINRRAAGKIRSELEDEIELSKSIMDGIKEGLEAISDNFDEIQKSLDKTDNDKKKGEKQKLLDDITKILENSKKSTWDLNELIDEGEIDYTGFTANVAISSVAYFGILLTPFRATVMIHKGYKYFFNIVKNTIRKALVMLQLNFDQFSNLIVTQSLRCAGVITATDTSSDIGEFYGNICAQIADSKSMSKKQLEKVKQLLSAAKQKFDQQSRADKLRDSAENMFNNLDPYNNTYTKSLETLRQYASDDVQKNLDAIKTSMNKLAGQEADLQTFSELLIAAAEEHAYAVSTSIYNKFAKMTEVFSLPNQQKLIDLILAANKEQKAEAKKIRDEKKASKELQEKIESRTNDAEEGLRVFKSLNGVEIEDLEGGEVSEDAEVKKYDESKIKADKWTYDEFSKLDKNDRDSFETWLEIHPEVLKKCDKSLQVCISSPYNYGYLEYVDSLIDYIGPCLAELDSLEESNFSILSYDEYLLESHKKKNKKKKKNKGSQNSSSSSSSSSLSSDNLSDDTEEEGYVLSDDEMEALDEKITDVKMKLSDLMALALGSDYADKEELSDEDRARLDYVIRKSKKENIDEGIIKELENVKTQTESKHQFFINFNNLDNSQIDDLKEMYEDESVAVAALERIGEKILKDKTFIKNSKYIVDKIKKCFEKKKKKVEVSLMMYIMLGNTVKKLNYMRDHDYVNSDEDTNNNESTSEKSGS